MPGLSGVVVAKNLDGRLEMVTLALEGARWQQWWRRWEPLEGGWTAWQAFGVPGSGGGFLPVQALLWCRSGSVAAN